MINYKFYEKPNYNREAVTKGAADITYLDDNDKNDNSKNQQCSSILKVLYQNINEGNIIEMEAPMRMLGNWIIEHEESASVLRHAKLECIIYHIFSNQKCQCLYDSFLPIFDLFVGRVKIDLSSFDTPEFFHHFLQNIFPSLQNLSNGIKFLSNIILESPKNVSDILSYDIIRYILDLSNNNLSNKEFLVDVFFFFTLACKETDYLRLESVNFENDNQGFAQQEFGKQEFGKQEFGKQEFSKQEFSKQEFSKQEFSKQEFSKQELSMHEFGEHEFGKQEFDNQEFDEFEIVFEIKQFFKMLLEETVELKIPRFTLQLIYYLCLDREVFVREFSDVLISVNFQPLFGNCCMFPNEEDHINVFKIIIFLSSVFGIARGLSLRFFYYVFQGSDFSDDFYINFFKVLKSISGFSVGEIDTMLPIIVAFIETRTFNVRVEALKFFSDFITHNSKLINNDNIELIVNYILEFIDCHGPELNKSIVLTILCLCHMALTGDIDCQLFARIVPYIEDDKDDTNDEEMGIIDDEDGEEDENREEDYLGMKISEIIRENKDLDDNVKELQVLLLQLRNLMGIKKRRVRTE